MKEALSQTNINYVYMDITGGMLALKSFLKIRDNNDSHKEAKANGRVGIPALSVDGNTYVLTGTDDTMSLLKELDLI